MLVERVPRARAQCHYVLGYESRQDVVVRHADVVLEMQHENPAVTQAGS